MLFPIAVVLKFGVIRIVFRLTCNSPTSLCCNSPMPKFLSSFVCLVGHFTVLLLHYCCWICSSCLAMSNTFVSVKSCQLQFFFQPYHKSIAHLFFDIPVLAMSDERYQTSTELFYSLTFLLLPLMKLNSPHV